MQIDNRTLAIVFLALSFGVMGLGYALMDLFVAVNELSTGVKILVRTMCASAFMMAGWGGHYSYHYYTIHRESLKDDVPESS